MKARYNQRLLVIIMISRCIAGPTLVGPRFIKELGGGGMGVVYLAKNIQMDRLEILKADLRNCADGNFPTCVSKLNGILSTGDGLARSTQE